MKVFVPRLGSLKRSVNAHLAPWGEMPEGSHSGLVRAPAKRLPGLKLGRGFESHSLRQSGNGSSATYPGQDRGRFVKKPGVQMVDKFAKVLGATVEALLT